jgi:hypothetical protein
MSEPAGDAAAFDEPRGIGRRAVVLAGFFLASYLLGVVAAGSSLVLIDALDALAAPWHGTARSVPDPGELLPELVASWVGAATHPFTAAMLAILAAMQTLLLVPIVGPLRTRPNGVSLLPSVIGAAGIAGCLAAMLVFVAIEVLERTLGFDVGRLLDLSTLGSIALLLATWSIAGGIWYWLLRRAGRSRDPRGLDRLVRLVFAATVVELLMTVPIYVMLRKRMNCYCFAPSFIAIVGGLAMLLWMCGPWAILLLTRRRREAWSSLACSRCGYPRRAGGSRCSECGHSYPSDGASAAAG